jgi:hypothetical protein
MQEAVAEVVEEMVVGDEEEVETAVAGHHRQVVVGRVGAVALPVVVEVETHAVIREAIPTNGEVTTVEVEDSNHRQ